MWRWHDLWWRPAVDLGLVRGLFSILAPDWVKHLPTPRRELFRSVYSRPAQGYTESVDAFDVTPPGCLLWVNGQPASDCSSARASEHYARSGLGGWLAFGADAVWVANQCFGNIVSNICYQLQTFFFGFVLQCLPYMFNHINNRKINFFYFNFARFNF